MPRPGTASTHPPGPQAQPQAQLHCCPTPKCHQPSGTVRCSHLTLSSSSPFPHPFQPPSLDPYYSPSALLTQPPSQPLPPTPPIPPHSRAAAPSPPNSAQDPPKPKPTTPSSCKPSVWAPCHLSTWLPHPHPPSLLRLYCGSCPEMPLRVSPCPTRSPPRPGWSRPSPNTQPSPGAAPRASCCSAVPEHASVRLNVPLRGSHAGHFL